MISVVLPYFNKEDQLPYTLLSLEKQTVKPDEVIVVDDGSKRKPKIKSNLPIKYIRLRNNGGYRTSVFAMNEGIRQSEGDIVILTSAETIQGRNNIEIVKHKLDLQPENVVVGKVIFSDALNNRFPERILKEPDLIETIKYHTWHQGFVSDDKMIVKYPQMKNGFYGFKRKTIYKVNGFDEELPYWGCNDTNLDLRLKMAGIKKIIVPTIFGLHQYHDRPPQTHMEKAVLMREVSDQPKDYYCRKGLV